MSYDLMVFDQDVAPTNRNDFLQWYEELMDSEDGPDSESTAGMNENLLRFYDAMRTLFPALNGPDAVPESEVDNPYVTDYLFSKNVIYMNFAWSLSEAAHAAVVNFAIQNNVGFFDVSADDGIITCPQ